MENVNLNFSKDLVKKWGAITLRNGNLVSDEVAFNNISFWDVMGPSLALYFLPQEINKKRSHFNLILSEFRPFLSFAKRYINDITQILLTKKKFVNNSDSILFLSFSTYMHRDVLLPIINKISKSEKYYCISLNEIKNNFENIYRYKDSKIIVNSIYLFLKIQSFKRTVLNDENFQKIVSSDCSRSWKEIKPLFNWLFNFYFNGLIIKFLLSENLFKKNKILCVVSPDVVDPRTRVINAIAKRNNIKSIELQFGPIDENGVEWNFLNSDKIAVWGFDSYNVLLNHDVEPSKMVLTGSSRHDYLLSKNHIIVENYSAKLNLNKYKKVILFASTYIQKEYKNHPSQINLGLLKDDIISSIINFPDILLIFKPHPIENEAIVKTKFSNISNVYFAESSEDIRNLILISDAFVSLGSTSTIDALICKKIVICPIYNNWIWSKFLIHTGAVLIANSKIDIIFYYDKILKNSKEVYNQNNISSSTYLKNLLIKADNNSTDRIILTIKNLISNENCTFS
jgi:CDP-glycerol glycerophosphotransferase (TagB/SpsB family)